MASSLQSFLGAAWLNAGLTGSGIKLLGSGEVSPALSSTCCNSVDLRNESQGTNEGSSFASECLH